MPATKTKTKALASTPAPKPRSIEDLAAEITNCHKKRDEIDAHLQRLQLALRDRLVAVGICEEVPPDDEDPIDL